MLTSRYIARLFLSMYPPTVGPAHRTICYASGPPHVASELFPVQKLSLRGWCRACHLSHTDWWLMDQNEYQCDGLTIVLCGKCEHTSALEHLESTPGRPYVRYRPGI